MPRQVRSLTSFLFQYKVCANYNSWGVGLLNPWCGSNRKFSSYNWEKWRDFTTMEVKTLKWRVSRWSAEVFRVECWELCEDCPLGDGSSQDGSSLLISSLVLLLLLNRNLFFHQEICFELYQSKYTLKSASQLKITRIWAIFMHQTELVISICS